jgi:AcrR family transcriptional regulator
MNIKRRTQAERTAATRDALVAAGRALFGARGYGDVGTEEIVRSAGVSRGALYHQFADKAELFAAVFQSVEEVTSARITAAVTAANPDDPIAAMQLGTAVFLDICTEPEMARIMLIDAPAVLGEQRWADISTEYNMGLVLQLISRGIEIGRIPAQPIVPLGRILLGALREGALYLAGADDPAAAREQVGAVLNGIIESVARPAELAPGRAALPWPTPRRPTPRRPTPRRPTPRRPTPRRPTRQTGHFGQFASPQA